MARLGPGSILLFVMLHTSLAAASVLGLSPAPPPIWHPAQDLARDEIFERLDATHDRLHAQEFETTQELLELAVLNLFTKRPEDRERALDLLLEARSRDPDRLDLVLWQLKALHRAGDATTAEALMRHVANEFDGQGHTTMPAATPTGSRRHVISTRERCAKRPDSSSVPGNYSRIRHCTFTRSVPSL